MLSARHSATSHHTALQPLAIHAEQWNKAKQPLFHAFRQWRDDDVDDDGSVLTTLRTM